jgi:hypothetical protein
MKTWRLQLNNRGGRKKFPLEAAKLMENQNLIMEEEKELLALSVATFWREV